MDLNRISNTIGYLKKDGALDHLITEIKQDIALEIINSQLQDVKKREDLYMLTQALKCLDEKLQEYVNIYEN